MEDIFIACIGNLQGFAEAIESVYPQAEVQLCIVHQIRNSHKYLSYKDTEAFMKDLQGFIRLLPVSKLKEAWINWKPTGSPVSKCY